MPEAVHSNSIHAPIGQPPSTFNSKPFEGAVRDIEAFAFMLEGTLLKHTDIPEDFSKGICNLLQGALGNLHSAIELSKERAKAATKKYSLGAPAFQVLVSSVRERLQAMTADIWRECNPNGDEGSAQTIQFVCKIAQRYTTAIMTKLSDEEDALEAGSFLPWAELRIRSEVARDAGMQFSDIEYAKSLLVSTGDEPLNDAERAAS